MPYSDVGLVAAGQAAFASWANGVRNNQEYFNSLVSGIGLIDYQAANYYATATTFNVELINYTWPSSAKFIVITGHVAGTSDGGANASAGFRQIIDATSLLITGGYAYGSDDDNAYYSKSYNDSTIATPLYIGTTENAGGVSHCPGIYINSIDSSSKNIVLYIKNNDGSDWAATGYVLMESYG